MSRDVTLSSEMRHILLVLQREGEFRAQTQTERNRIVKMHGQELARRHETELDLCYPTEKGLAMLSSAPTPAFPEVAKPRNPSSLSTYEAMTGMRDLAVPLHVGQIDIGHRLRLVDQQKVDALKASISDLGLRTAITVRGDSAAMNDQAIRVRLVAGAHRLEAFRQLGREWIGAVFDQGDDLDAELWEIDENLIRADLTPADRALFVFRRKEIYLMRHPETEHGAIGNGREKSRQLGDSTAEPKRFSAATAEATGQSERTIQRDAERGEKISDRALRMLRGTRHDKGATLDRLKGLAPPEQEVYVKALFDADRARLAESKTIRSDQLATRRTVRTELINAIAAQGRVQVGRMPRAAYPVGYVDAPWEQEAYSDVTGQDKGLMYPAMPLDEIKALCAGDKSPFTFAAILYFWVPSNRIDDAIDVIRAWGFEFVTLWTWDKIDIGMGRWLRDRTEHLIIAKRGDFPGLIPGTQPASLHAEKKTEHSRKPEHFAQEIDRLYPSYAQAGAVPAARKPAGRGCEAKRYVGFLGLRGWRAGKRGGGMILTCFSCPRQLVFAGRDRDGTARAFGWSQGGGATDVTSAPRMRRADQSQRPAACARPRHEP